MIAEQQELSGPREEQVPPLVDREGEEQLHPSVGDLWHVAPYDPGLE